MGQILCYCQNKNLFHIGIFICFDDKDTFYYENKKSLHTSFIQLKGGTKRIGKSVLDIYSFLCLQSYSFSRTYNHIPRGLFVNIFLSFLDINFPFLRFGYPPSLKVEHPIVHF